MALIFMTHTLLAPGVEASLWSDRRASLQTKKIRSQQMLAQLPVPNHVAMGLETAFPIMPSLKSNQIKNWVRHNPKPKENRKGDGAGPAWLENLHLKNGDIQDLYVSDNPDKPVIIQIQDIHGVLEAQENMSDILAQLNARIPIDFIAMEGAGGLFPVNPFRDYPNKNITQTISRTFLEDGLIGGPEYFALTAEKPLPLIGVEDERLYQANIGSFKKSLETAHVTSKMMTILEDWNGRLKEKIYSESLRTFDGIVSSFHDEKTSLGDYLNYLLENEVSREKQPPQMALLKSALEKEKMMDFRRIENERSKLLYEISQRLPRETLVELIGHGLSQKAGRISQSQFYDSLVRICHRLKIDLVYYPQFQSYIDYLNMVDRINPDELLKQIEAFEMDRYLALAESADEMKLVVISHQMSLVKKLLEHQLTPHEWNDYAKRFTEIRRLPNEFQVIAKENNLNFLSHYFKNWANSLKVYESFYQLAAKRNEAFLENIENRISSKTKSVILVSGGFHSDGVSSLLRQKDYSYVVVTPHMNQKGESDYLSIFSKNTTPLEELFRGEKLNLVAPRALGFLSHVRSKLFIGLFAGLQESLMAAKVVRGTALAGKPLEEKIKKELTDYLSAGKNLPTVTDKSTTLNLGLNGQLLSLRHRLVRGREQTEFNMVVRNPSQLRSEDKGWVATLEMDLSGEPIIVDIYATNSFIDDVKKWSRYQLSRFKSRITETRDLIIGTGVILVQIGFLNFLMALLEPYLSIGQAGLPISTAAALILPQLRLVGWSEEEDEIRLIQEELATVAKDSFVTIEFRNAFVDEPPIIHGFFEMAWVGGKSHWIEVRDEDTGTPSFYDLRRIETIRHPNGEIRIRKNLFEPYVPKMAVTQKIRIPSDINKDDMHALSIRPDGKFFAVATSQFVFLVTMDGEILIKHGPSDVEDRRLEVESIRWDGPNIYIRETGDVHWEITYMFDSMKKITRDPRPSDQDKDRIQEVLDQSDAGWEVMRVSAKSKNNRFAYLASKKDGSKVLYKTGVWNGNKSAIEKEFKNIFWPIEPLLMEKIISGKDNEEYFIFGGTHESQLTMYFPHDVYKLSYLNLPQKHPMLMEPVLRVTNPQEPGEKSALYAWSGQNEIYKLELTGFLGESPAEETQADGMIENGQFYPLPGEMHLDSLVQRLRAELSNPELTSEEVVDQLLHYDHIEPIVLIIMALMNRIESIRDFDRARFSLHLVDLLISRRHDLESPQGQFVFDFIRHNLNDNQINAQINNVLIRETELEAMAMADPLYFETIRDRAAFVREKLSPDASAGVADILDPLLTDSFRDKIAQSRPLLVLYYVFVAGWEALFFIYEPALMLPLFVVLHPLVRFIAGEEKSFNSLMVEFRSFSTIRQSLAIGMLAAVYFGSRIVIGDFAVVPLIFVHLIWDIKESPMRNQLKRTDSSLNRFLRPALLKISEGGISILKTQNRFQAGVDRDVLNQAVRLQLYFEGEDPRNIPTGLSEGELSNLYRLVPYLEMDLSRQLSNLDQTTPASLIEMGKNLGVMLASHVQSAPEERELVGEQALGIIKMIVSKWPAVMTGRQIEVFSRALYFGFEYASQGVFLKTVSDFKKPVAPLIHLPPDMPSSEKQQLTKTLIAKLQELKKSKSTTMFVVDQDNLPDAVKAELKGVQTIPLHLNDVLDKDGFYYLDGVMNHPGLSDQFKESLIDGSTALPIFSPVAHQWRFSKSALRRFTQVDLIYFQIIGSLVIEVNRSLHEAIEQEWLTLIQA